MIVGCGSHFNLSGGGKVQLIQTVLGYLLTPESMFLKEKEKSSLSTLTYYLVITAAAVALLVLADIVSSGKFSLWRIGGTLYILSICVLVTVVTLVLLHGLVTVIKNDSSISNSFKPVFTGSAYYTAMIVIGNIPGLFMGSLVAEWLVRVPLGIIGAIIFLWIALNGVSVLHKISVPKAFIITIVSFFLANLAVYYIAMIHSVLFVSWGSIG